MVWLAIIFMALLVYMTRVFGGLVMARIPYSHTLKRFLDATAICVIAGIVASLLAQAGSRELAAAATAVLAMALTRSALWAITAGVVTAALWTQLS